MRMRTDAAYASMGFLRIPSMKTVKMDICILMRMKKKSSGQQFIRKGKIALVFLTMGLCIFIYHVFGFRAGFDPVFILP